MGTAKIGIVLENEKVSVAVTDTLLTMDNIGVLLAELELIKLNYLERFKLLMDAQHK